jgi:DNA-binding CsgD family transcriptional regulator
VHLSREFENPFPALETAAPHLLRGSYKRSERPSEPSITDNRARPVRSVGKTETFLSPAQVDELVGLYREGVSVAELSRKFGIYTRTAAAHLVRRSVRLRQRGIAPEDVPEVARLYESGLTLMEVGRRLGVSQGTARRAVRVELGGYALAGIPPDLERLEVRSGAAV